MVRLKPQMTAAHQIASISVAPRSVRPMRAGSIKIEPTAKRSVTHTKTVLTSSTPKENSTLDKHARSEKRGFPLRPTNACSVDQDRGDCVEKRDSHQDGPDVLNTEGELDA